MKWNRRNRSAIGKASSSTVVATTAGASRRQALFEPLEDRKLMSCTIDLRVVGGSNTKAATATSVGQVIDLQIWAVVSGTTAGTNDGFQSITGSLLGTETASGGEVGNFGGVNLEPDYTGEGASTGTVVDLNGDGGLDVGSNNNQYIQGFFNARAGGIEQDGTVSGDSQSFLIGTATYTVKTLGSASTDLNFRARNISGGAFEAVWEEDGKYVTDESASLKMGAPIVISTTGTSSKNGSISGTISKVANGSTTAFSGATVYIDANNNGQLDSGETSTTTSSTGSYTFSGLAAGTYMVREIDPTGYNITAPSGGAYSVSIAASQAASGYNFTDTAVTSSVGSISGTVTNTVNGVTSAYSGITMYLDANNNGQHDTGEYEVKTSSSGAYDFTGLTAGTYHVRELPITNETVTTPSAGVYNVTITSGQNATGYNFADTGASTAKASITGVLDKVVNGVTSGFSGQTMYLDANNNGSHDSGEYEVTTNSSGGFVFTGIAAGTYHVRQLSVPSGYTLTTPSGGVYNVTLTAGQAASGVLFTDTAGTKGTIAGVVTKVVSGSSSSFSGVTMYLDANNNGVHDSGEYEVTTNSSGGYVFTGLAAGTFHVRELVPTGYSITTPSSATYTITLTAGQNSTGSNFTDTAANKGSISGTLTKTVSGKTTADSGVIMYIDANNNGQHDSGEYEATTNSSGAFSFTNLVAGTYYIRQIVPSGYKVSSPSAGYYKVTISAGQIVTGEAWVDVTA